MKPNGILNEELAPPAKGGSLIMVALLPFLIGPVIGLVTNFINSWASEKYFETVMGWNYRYIDIPIFAMLQGVYEGVLYGAVFSLIFTFYVKKAKHEGLGNRYFLRIFAGVTLIIVLCWCLGGVLGVVVFRIFPYLGPDEIYFSLNGVAPLRDPYGWVAGSIWGGMNGGVLALGWAVYRTSRQTGEFDTLLMKPGDVIDDGLMKTRPLLLKLNLAQLILAAIAPVIIGGLVGLGTSIVNGNIFWEHYSAKRIIQGGQEGLVLGFLFGLLFMLVLILSPKRRMSNVNLLRVYLQCVAIVIGCWVIGGTVGAMLYDQFIDIDPQNKFYPDRIRWRLGWSKNSFWGTRIGGLIALAWAVFASRPQKPG